MAQSCIEQTTVCPPLVLSLSSIRALPAPNLSACTIMTCDFAITICQLLTVDCCFIHDTHPRLRSLQVLQEDKEEHGQRDGCSATGRLPMSLLVPRIANLRSLSTPSVLFPTDLGFLCVTAGCHAIDAPTFVCCTANCLRLLTSTLPHQVYAV
jgi:hypothetical protein